MSRLFWLPRKKCVTITIMIVVTLMVVISRVDKNKLQPQHPSTVRPSQLLSQPAEDYNRKLGTFASNSTMMSIPPSQSKILLMSDYQCQDSVCSTLLSEEEKTMYERCTPKANKIVKKKIIPAKCHFLNSTGRAPVALSSFPGSGNTWIRGLLEKATGICTGGVCCELTSWNTPSNNYYTELKQQRSIYCDGILRRQGFAGEHVTTGAVLAVKMHLKMTAQTKVKGELSGIEIEIEKRKRDIFLQKHYGAAIHLVRNPFGALVAEFNREKSNRSLPGGNHINTVGKERFGNSSDWRKYLQLKARIWKAHFISWNQKYIPVLHVLYEDVKEDAVREVKRMLEFLRVPYSEEELREILSEDFDLFHRSKHEDFDPYTPEQREFVNQQIREAVETVKANNNGDALGLSYL